MRIRNQRRSRLARNSPDSDGAERCIENVISRERNRCLTCALSKIVTWPGFNGFPLLLNLSKIWFATLNPAVPGPLRGHKGQIFKDWPNLPPLRVL